ncbi:uncharacterized protein SPSK_06773 [Sporothrix schenckii 1099-18]|uniref:Uncharacterized protein n=1 Tax=Sporothrix schenckii 1099-18 TaxID=1397361 RepID=A0A0F2MML1_SPOSC|nr:uncharacterized protein SPSK_06773 [Sporothrix schenckii 1099-18]KJR89421.1 hypothetical protein SPSK_06773 [Sporothrix schenckii 1099-18]
MLVERGKEQGEKEMSGGANMCMGQSRQQRKARDSRQPLQQKNKGRNKVWYEKKDLERDGYRNVGKGRTGAISANSSFTRGSAMQVG